MSNDVWKKIDLWVISTIILCMAASYSRHAEKPEKLYMMKSISNVLYLQQKLYKLYMKEGKVITKYLNTFNKIIVDLLSVNF